MTKLPPPDAPYFAVWREYRQWGRRYWTTLLGGPPTLLALYALCERVLPLHAQAWVSNALTIAWLVATVTVGWPYLFFLCPRCDRLFNMTWLWASTWRRHCAHCGLAKWAPGPDEP